ncbi:sodium:proton antiporter [Anaerobacillus alkaliphilus]|uniref:Sodium:proton antiporter n=2 Tax=Anaerobacillus alkaliphilus TaxID=1548597 RepID=A0A4Q0VS12_9BACI|nr:sodium:proton antiporter [Anaerobacillus alkaliphilus]
MLTTLLVTMLSVFFVYRYRYRIINIVLGTRWIRRLAVTGALQIPFIKNRLYARFMPF